MGRPDLKALLERVSTWPEERQRQLAELALEIEAEMSDSAYNASAEELQAIDEGLAGEVASREEVEAAFASFRRT
jgi:HAMP domain-containing protein